MVWEQALGWSIIAMGALRASVNAFLLLASLRPERAAQRGGPGYHKRTAEGGSSVARSQRRSSLLWGLYFVTFGLTTVTNQALWSQVVFYVALTVAAALWLASFVRRRRQNQVRKSNSPGAL
jgi:hypothetical protein